MKFAKPHLVYIHRMQDDSSCMLYIDVNCVINYEDEAWLIVRYKLIKGLIEFIHLVGMQLVNCAFTRYGNQDF